jgi:hypothetical protein
MKTCTKCSACKPLDEFYNNRNQKGGKMSCCKPCHYTKLNTPKVTKEQQLATRRATFIKYYAKNADELKARSNSEYHRNKGNKKRKDRLVSPHTLLNRYRHDAKRRGGREFLITKEQFMDLWQKPCYYCNGSIPTIGIDRVNNDVGYTVDNIVPCCTRCNLAKRNLSKPEFIAMCYAIIKTHERRESDKNFSASSRVAQMNHGGAFL